MNRNSALIWLPKIQEILPSPTTEIVRYDHYSIIDIFDNAECKPFEDLAISVGERCDKIGYPCFIRTDLSSAKHGGPSCYKVGDIKEVKQVLFNTLEDNEMKFFMQREQPRAILIREWLNLESPFEAFNGHPISREWRFFANEKEVICFHPYWPEDSIEDYDPNKSDWRELLADLHKVPDELHELKLMAILAARVYGVYSSIDFAKDVNGKWWLTDMAVAEDSYHWPSCEFN